MSKDYNHEIGYETLLADFKRYNKQTPKGVTLVKEGQNIYLQFKTTNKSRSKYKCSCSFTLDGMVEALSKTHKVAEKLKESSSETEFWQWYDSTIKESVSLKDDQLTFGEAILRVEEDFWNRLSKTRRKRDKDNPSDVCSWGDTYLYFYKYLPSDKVVNLSDIKAVVGRYSPGTRRHKYAVSVMKKLTRTIKREDIYGALKDIEVVQTDFGDLQTVTLSDFLSWRDKTLGEIANLGDRADLDVRKAWLWVFSMQVVYGLRISEVFAIANLEKSLITKDGVTILALNDSSNTDNLIYIGEKTNLGTTTKTNKRISRPIIPPGYSN